MAKRAFTLIELLIVVAIIAILAAIAVPNFLEAQVRAKVSRVKNDLRSLSTALESYAVDNGKYPICSARLGGIDWQQSGGIHHVVDLSTPVAYVTTVSFRDPFVIGPPDAEGWVRTGIPYSFLYIILPGYRTSIGEDRNSHWAKWWLNSHGPDQVKGPDPHGANLDWWAAWYAMHEYDPDNARFIAWTYDPTNGTMSNGDISRYQGQ